MKKAFLAFIFIFVLNLIFTKTSLSKSNFSTKYNIEYDILNNSITHVTFQINIQNLTETLYVSNYKLDIGLNDIQNIKAFDSIGEISPKLLKTNKGNVISVEANKRVVGKDKILPIKITFDTKDIARDLNNIWDINIPGVSNHDSLVDYKISVKYPQDLGKPTFVKPVLPVNSSSSGLLNFSKEDLKQSGISLTFGKSQIFNFDLTYHLKNNNVFATTSEIALPLNTNYQNIEIDSITPKPINIIKDTDSNWIANYKLTPAQEIIVNVKGKVKINLIPGEESISNEAKAIYTKPQKYWESDNSKIIDIARKLKTPENIYNYVAQSLKYDYSKFGSESKRLGALKTLENPNTSVCLEFTDLFIAIARAAGIPSREVDGYAYSNNDLQRPILASKDILHAWPEYYDYSKKRWIMIDPTWGNTTDGVDYFKTLDFDHIAFIIRGSKSTSPIPAGGYKENSESDKDIIITVGDKFSNNKSVNASISTSKQLIAGLPQAVNIEVYNEGNQEVKEYEINLDHSQFNNTKTTLYSGSVLPFGKQKITTNLTFGNILTNTEDTTKITIDNNSFYKKVKIIPFYKSDMFIGGLFFVGLSIIVSIIIFGLRRLPIFK